MAVAAQLDVQAASVVRRAQPGEDLGEVRRAFAEGEVVVLGEYFGVRITRLLGALPVPDAAAAA